MPKANLESIIASLKVAISNSSSISELNNLKKEFLGKESFISQERKTLINLSKVDKVKYGNQINECTNSIEKLITKAISKEQIKLRLEKENKESVDISIDWVNNSIGARHILQSTISEVVHIFSDLGFKVESGPEAETAWHNFDALNTPIWHPARYESDTLYLDYGDDNQTLLRTQTSTVQARHMLKNKPPIYIVVPGRVFRSDQLDATHSPVFHQIEGLAVDENITFSDLKGTLNHFAKEFFGKNIKTKFIPHFFPFTEPSAEMLVKWKDDKWLEILGCGMVDPNVFKNVGYKKIPQGYAFGMGVERLAMIRYEIDHIKSFYDNDIRFLEQFK